jgi:osmoprotectant transport system ATP-binding protein
MLRILAGLVEPTTGSVFFNNVEMTPRNVLELRHRMGYVIQEGGLFPHLTIDENVGLLARHLKRPEDWIRSRIDTLCELTQLPLDALSRFPLQLSGGQRQRVSLMRALMLEPDVVLLDEPLGALDPIIRRELQDELNSIFDRLGVTAIMVTHDVHEADVLADRILLLSAGEIVQSGTMEDLVRNPANDFVRRFLAAQGVGA